MKKIIARMLVLFMVFGLVQPGNTVRSAKAASTDANIYYTTHCQTYGWLPEVKNGEESGTHGQAKRLEAIKIRVESELSGSVEYEVHCQTYGWGLGAKKDGEECGTHGQAKRLEAIKIRLTGQLAEVYDVVYRVHRQTYGWSDWVKNGEECGTTGQAKRLESIQIKLVRKGGDDSTVMKYTTHCQSYGWLPYVSNGEESGTHGQAKRLEAIKIDIPNSAYAGGVTYSVHCQSYGWMNWQVNDMQAGTSGQAKRLEAIKIKLTGELADHYDIYYRVHSQTYGWLDWACNGEIAGTAGLAKRLEAIQIVLVNKGQSAPGETECPYVDSTIAKKIEQEKAEEAKRLEEEKRQLEQQEKDAFNEANQAASSEKLREILNSATLNPTVTNDPQVDALVQQVLAEKTNAGMDNYDKLFACYKWIIDNAIYRYDKDTTGSWNNTSVNYSNIQDRKTVSFGRTVLLGVNGQRYGTCINYASAMAIFARALGFDAYYTGGETLGANNSYGEHYWCVIKIDGIWYNFDPNNADNSWANPLNFFGKTNTEWLSLGYKFTHLNEYTGEMEKAEDYIKGGTYK